MYMAARLLAAAATVWSNRTWRLSLAPLAPLALCKLSLAGGRGETPGDRPHTPAPTPEPEPEPVLPVASRGPLLMISTGGNNATRSAPSALPTMFLAGGDSINMSSLSAGEPPNDDVARRALRAGGDCALLGGSADEAQLPIARNEGTCLLGAGNTTHGAMCTAIAQPFRNTNSGGSMKRSAGRVSSGN
jgi:hypothetical protein